MQNHVRSGVLFEVPEGQIPRDRSAPGHADGDVGSLRQVSDISTYLSAAARVFMSFRATTRAKGCLIMRAYSERSKDAWRCVQAAHASLPDLLHLPVELATAAGLERSGLALDRGGAIKPDRPMGCLMDLHHLGKLAPACEIGGRKRLFVGNARQFRHEVELERIALDLAGLARLEIALLKGRHGGRGKDFMPLTFGPCRSMALKISPAVLPLDRVVSIGRA